MMEIDRLIIENVLELHYTENSFGLWVILNECEDPVLFRPTKNIQDAWIVLDKVCMKHNWRAIIDRNQTWTQVNFKNQMGAYLQFLGYKETPMMAICEAVLDSVGIEIKTLI